MIGPRRLIGRRLERFDRIAVWGAGNLGRLALRRWLPRDRVVALIDSDAGKSGADCLGLTIEAPPALAAAGAQCLVICVAAHEKVRAQAAALGFAGETVFIYELLLPGDRVVGELEALSIDWIASRNEGLLRFLAHRPQILVNVSYRLTRAAAGSIWLTPLYWLCAIWHALNCVIFSIHLPRRTQIGPGLVFAHHGTITFTEGCRIGAFFTIYQGCTVGRADGRAPVIGDFVTLYPMSLVLGASRIGSHSRVGAMSLVLDLVCDEGSTLAGIPARVRRAYRA